LFCFQVYDAVHSSLAVLYSANGGKLPRRVNLASEKDGADASASDLSQRLTAGSGAVQQPESIDRLVSFIAGDDDDTPALEYMFRQHACAWVRAAVEGWAQAKTHMSAAIKTADSLQPPALMPLAARSLLHGDYALITYETARLNQQPARLNQQTPNSNILIGLSQKWVKSRHFAVKSASVPNVDKLLWARSFLLWYRACVGLSDCNFNYNVDNKEKQDTQVCRCIPLGQYLYSYVCHQICKVASEFIERLQASFASSGLTCPALDVINCSAKFNQVGCSVSESPATAMQDGGAALVAQSRGLENLDLQWIQNLACAMSSSKVGLGQNAAVSGTASVSPVMTVIQLANLRRFSQNFSHAASILSSALQLCESGSSEFLNPCHRGMLHHNLGDLLRERQQYDECKTQLDRADSCFPANSANDFEAFLVASALDRERLLQESDSKRSMFAEIAAVMATRARLLENQNLLEEAEKLFAKSLYALRVSSTAIQPLIFVIFVQLALFLVHRASLLAAGSDDVCQALARELLASTSRWPMISHANRAEKWTSKPMLLRES